MAEKKSKVGKIPKPSTESKHITKSLISAGHSEWPFGLSPSGDKYFDLLSLQMINDCLDETKRMLSMVQWCLHVGLYPEDLDRYKDQNETFRKAYNISLSAIGERRENEIRNGAPTSLAFVLPQYNKKWKAERDERATLKANLEGKSGNEIHVHLEPVPTTDIVKPRITEEKS